MPWITPITSRASLLVLLCLTQRGGALTWRDLGRWGADGDRDKPWRGAHHQSPFLGTPDTLWVSSVVTPSADVRGPPGGPAARLTNNHVIIQSCGWWNWLWCTGWVVPWGKGGSESCHRKSTIPKETLETGISQGGSPEPESFRVGFPLTEGHVGLSRTGHTLYGTPRAGFCQGLALALRSTWVRLCTWLAAEARPWVWSWGSRDPALEAAGEVGKPLPTSISNTTIEAVQQVRQGADRSMARAWEQWEGMVLQVKHGGPGMTAGSAVATEGRMEGKEYALQEAVQEAKWKDSVAPAGMPARASRSAGPRRSGRVLGHA